MGRRIETPEDRPTAAEHAAWERRWRGRLIRLGLSPEAAERTIKSLRAIREHNHFPRPRNPTTGADQ